MKTRIVLLLAFFVPVAAAFGQEISSGLALADGYFEDGRWEEAVVAYEEAKHETQFTVYDLHNMAYSLMQLSRYDRARRLLRNIIDIEETDALAHYNLGVLHFITDRYSLATTCLERAADLDPSNPDCWYMLAYAAINNGDLKRAWEVLDILIVLDEDDAMDVFETLSRLESDRADPTSDWW
jgi:tetratricopeptide (TPR) repeat protein